MILEYVAALHGVQKQLNSELQELPDYYVMLKHFKRKNGPGLFYGQKK
jgi:hypothetical protein